MKKKWYLKPWLFGIIAGSIFVFAEVVFDIYPPTAYSFCLTCHTRDLINTIINFLFHTHYQTTLIAKRVLMLTPPFVILGAFLAARFFHEHRIQRGNNPILYFILGFIVMIIGILIFGCPTRIIIRSGYGDFYGIAALLSMFLGIWCATIIIIYNIKYRGKNKL